MSVTLDLQLAQQQAPCPSEQQLRHWVEHALAQRVNDTELTLRIVDEAEIQQLNADYRDKDKTTNVLSFPFQAPPGIEINLLGDIIICAKVVNDEAKAQNKTNQAHWAHMVIHGCLHLLGYDHIDLAEAEQMEQIEIDILRKLGYDNPYQIIDA